MASSFNRITIVGHLGRDAEMKYTPQGTAVCSFSIASTERRKDKSGEYQDQTTWFRVTLFGKQAEAVSQYLQKGKQVFVEGRLRTEEYTDREGARRTSLEVTANEVHLLGSRQNEGSSGYAPTTSASAPSKPRSIQQDDFSERTPPEDDIPF